MHHSFALLICFLVTFTYAQDDCLHLTEKYTGECISYYDNGNVKLITNAKNGQFDGKLMSYYEDGNIESIAFFKEGKPEGEQLGFYPTGEKMYVGEINNGNGTIEYFYINGNTKNRTTLEDYLETAAILYNEDGSITPPEK